MSNLLADYVEAGRVQDRMGPFRGFVTPRSNTQLPFSPGTQVLEPLEIFIRSNGCKLAQDRYNGAARQLVSVVMVTPSVPRNDYP